MKKPNILIVDDEQIILTGLERIFEGTDYNVKTVLSGKDALKAVKNEHFDIVYTDMVMSGMNGAELCRRIKKLSPKSEVVLFSGTPAGMMEFWAQFVMEGGKDEILRKPLSKKDMLQVTEKLLREMKEE